MKLRERIAKIFSFGASLVTFVVYIMGGIIQDAWNRLDPGQRGAALFMAVIGLIIAVVGVGVMFYFILSTIIPSAIRLMLPKALLAYIKGYNLIQKYSKAFSRLLGDINAADLVYMLGIFVKATAGGDNESQNEVISNIEKVADEIDKDTRLAALFKFKQSDLDEVISAKEQGETLELKFSAAIASVVANILKNEFNVPQSITSDYISLSKKVNLEQEVREDVDKRSLPPELIMLAVLTSPNVKISLSAGNNMAVIEFNALEFGKQYGQVTSEEIFDFLNVYMEAFAKKRHELSEYLIGKFEELEGIKERSLFEEAK
jgi:hypothetical protein